MGSVSDYLSAKAGSVADISATLLRALFEQGADIHVAMPNYRKIFNRKIPLLVRRAQRILPSELPEERIHLAADRDFYYLDHIPNGNEYDAVRISLNFQREVMNDIIPRVLPDLIHCQDWMTGLIPAFARKLNIPCLFTMHNAQSAACTLSRMEDIGIDAASFWQYLFYEQFPYSYETSRDANPVDLLSSGVFASDYFNTGGTNFLHRIIGGEIGGLDKNLQHELAVKMGEGKAVSISNAPDPSFNPTTDKGLLRRYHAKNHHAAKQYNKLYIQELLGLSMDSSAPVLFWPSGLDSAAKGGALLSEILSDVLFEYSNCNLQVVIAGDALENGFAESVESHRLNFAACGYEERLVRLAYAASDFVLIPELFEPSDLSQMIGPIYGSIPIAHEADGLHKDIEPLNIGGDRGNAFLFKNCDAAGLMWAVREALRFYALPQAEKSRQIERIMIESASDFSHSIMVCRYIELYEKVLNRAIVPI
ncbi:MAG: glycogen synthase [Desulfobacteraceae bacterium]|nr:MAG: glycogen synthase [Desulfobacteraceae bacterium]